MQLVLQLADHPVKILRLLHRSKTFGGDIQYRRGILSYVQKCSQVDVFTSFFSAGYQDEQNCIDSDYRGMETHEIFFYFSIICYFFRCKLAWFSKLIIFKIEDVHGWILFFHHFLNKTLYIHFFFKKLINQVVPQINYSLTFGYIEIWPQFQRNLATINKNS